MKNPKLTETAPVLPPHDPPTGGRVKNLPGSATDPNISMFVVGGNGSTNAILGDMPGGAEGDLTPLQWTPATEEWFKEFFEEIIGFDRANGPDTNFSTLAGQFTQAALQQPDAVFAFRAGFRNFPIVLSFRSGMDGGPRGYCYAELTNPDWFASAGADGDEDEDDPLFPNSPGTYSLEHVEKTVSRLLQPSRATKPIREASGWRISVPRPTRARGLGESVPTEAAEYLAGLSDRTFFIREGAENYHVLFRFEEDAKEFSSRLDESFEPFRENPAEQIALHLLRED